MFSCVRSRAATRAQTRKNTELLLDRLSTGQRALRKIRWQISGTMAFAGGILAASSSLWLSLRLIYSGDVKHLDLSISWTISVLGMASLVLAPLPDDTTLTRISVCGVATLCGLFTSYETLDAIKHLRVFAEAQCWEQDSFINYHHQRMSKASCVWYLCLCVWNVSWNVLFMGIFLSTAALQRSPVIIQERMWRFLTLFFQVNVFVDIVSILVDIVTVHRLSTNCFFVFGDFTGLWLTCYEGVPRRIQEMLRRYFEATERTAAAAGVASLVGNCPVHEALEQAIARFRVISLDKVSRQDLSGNQPSPGLYNRSVPASLGSCDAFISHSWSDDPDAKWNALMAWKSKFMNLHGRTPLVWLDKACINQSDIDANLRSLPVFLSGCDALLVLCGTTFLSRLWCVLEIFTFVHMGGKTHDINCISLLLPGQEESDWNAIRVLCAQFDVRHCDCSVADDKDKILSIIRTGFGSMESFNHAVRRMMRRIDGLSSQQLIYSFTGTTSSSSSTETSDSDSLNPYMGDSS